MEAVWWPAARCFGPWKLPALAHAPAQPAPTSVFPPLPLLSSPPPAGHPVQAARRDALLRALPRRPHLRGQRAAPEAAAPLCLCHRAGGLLVVGAAGCGCRWLCGVLVVGAAVGHVSAAGHVSVWEQLLLVACATVQAGGAAGWGRCRWLGAVLLGMCQCGSGASWLPAPPCMRAGLPGVVLLVGPVLGASGGGPVAGGGATRCGADGWGRCCWLGVCT